MDNCGLLLISTVLWIASTAYGAPTDTKTLKLSMPAAHSNKPDDLICHAVKLNPDHREYILSYNPQASMKTAHHMMIYGCINPGSTETMWECGGEEKKESDVCAQEGAKARKIVFAWANNAPRKSLPEGVGLRVGGDTQIQYLVLQLHYKRKFKPDEFDYSGVHIEMTTKVQPLQMGFYILGSWGFIPPGMKEFHLESGCPWDKNYTIHPFAYRTHSHNIGRVTAAYRIRNDTWTELGRMSPQQPQTFYPVTHGDMVIEPGDTLVNRCTMCSIKRKDKTIIGPTNQDEMCNFYFMYYTNKTENLDDEYCFNSAQDFHWSKYFQPDQIPADVSNLQGVKLLEPEMEPDDLINM